MTAPLTALMPPPVERRLEPLVVRRTERAPRRPVLRYHGGKWRLAPWICAHFPAHRLYVEPFGGAASVLLRKPRSYGEIYNDLDGEIVNVFRVLRDNGHALRAALELTPFAREEFAESYMPHSDPIEQARRTIVRSFQGFGSAAVCGEGFRLPGEFQPQRHYAGARLAQLPRAPASAD